MKKIKIATAIFFILITIISVFSYFSGSISNFQITLQVLGRYAFMLISLSGAACIIYHFFRVFFGNHKYRKLICYSLTAVVVALCITWYVLDHQPKVVRMQEDVLYILPKSSN